jgi:hypothetical protein
MTVTHNVASDKSVTFLFGCQFPHLSSVAKARAHCALQPWGSWACLWQLPLFLSCLCPVSCCYLTYHLSQTQREEHVCAGSEKDQLTSDMVGLQVGGEVALGIPWPLVRELVPENADCYPRGLSASPRLPNNP